ncbi:putative iron-sulfur cluster-binding metallochaperone [Acaryochloris sp. CCMEE 5410]|uniref:putative iron-sulfur cluster-binding metallochaperone n=1 Tax=Acaryochloris sp. CCMEE 5410 TaxID=310037 RepID=UPI00024843E6|nr:copper chaperone Copz family protein [Acaryochloris sp. CCMEE 5410]KAI9129924.1 copper chaperone Copz family protein [Acaryochloris sp. CCMEE 5410]
MSQCCCPPSSSTKTSFTCPQGNCRGKPIQLITLKSLLKPAALERLEPRSDYRFCDTPACPVVYFSNQGSAYTVQDLKVSVFQKDNRDDVPVCYCFGWTRQRIQSEMEWSENPQVVKIITAHIKTKRCGCEVNNPQGSCCLANVRHVIVDYRHPDSH